MYISNSKEANKVFNNGQNNPIDYDTIPEAEVKYYSNDDAIHLGNNPDCSPQFDSYHIFGNSLTLWKDDTLVGNYTLISKASFRLPGTNMVVVQFKTVENDDLIEYYEM